MNLYVLLFWVIQNMYERIQPVPFLLSGLYFREGKQEDKFSLTKVLFSVKTIFIYRTWKMTYFSFKMMF